MISQQPIDLLPDSLRRRSEAGLRAGRYITAVISAVVVVVLLSVQSRILLNKAQAELVEAETMANQVLATEDRASELARRLSLCQAALEQYRRVAHPIDVSDVLTTIIHELPDGVTLDRLDIDAGARRLANSPRRRGVEPESDGDRPRTLQGELSGFAPSDEEIADVVARLDGNTLFDTVSLDFSRTRAVRGRVARAFRISFRIDLEQIYDVIPVDGGGADHVE